MRTDIKKIMVPVDFSETCAHATNHAGWLAATAKAELFLVHVLPHNHYYFETPEPFYIPINDIEIRKEAEERIAFIAKELGRKFRIKPCGVILQGRTSIELIDFINARNIDIVLMGTHGAKGLEEIFIGSNAQHLVSQAPCPVITFQQELKNPGFRSIVLPIDRSRHSREKVADTIRLAKICNSKVHVVGLLDSNEEGDYDKLQIVLDQVQTALISADVSCTRHTIKGENIAIEAMKFADSIHADLIMILTEEESVLGRIDLGPLSRHIVNHSKIPVMSMNPHYGNFEALDLTGAYYMQ